MRRVLPKPSMIVLVVCGFVLKADGLRGEGAQESAPTQARILFLHHSTGECVWNGGVKAWFDTYNKAHKTAYQISEQNFPKEQPYGWNNYPYDYWNIWVRHAGQKPFKSEPTLEMLTPKYDVIIFKHCFPVSGIDEDGGSADVASEDKRIENYKLQYAALKKKLREFPKTRFIVWTGAALVKGETDEAAARRAKTFFDWVRTTWDERGDNIFIWDFRSLETEGGLFLKADYAAGDSHPNETFSRKVAPLFCQRIVDVIRGAGDTANITGKGGDSKAEAPPANAASETRPPEPPAPSTAPAVSVDRSAATAPTSGAWVLDDAEDPNRLAPFWGKAATYTDDAKGHSIKLRFVEGQEEDWGDYGPHRIVITTPAAKNIDISRYRYVALRVKTAQDLNVVFTLITRPDSLPRTDESYFGFTGYLRPKPGDWAWQVLDLTKLELAAEGDKAYAAAGKPTRPQHLTSLRWAVHKKGENADWAVDDITFYRVLPPSLSGSLQTP